MQSHSAVGVTLLPNNVLDPGYPRRICLEIACKWLHELGFHVLDKKKGIYIDGHEHDDVIQHRKTFLRQMISSGFLLKDHAPNDEAKEAFSCDLESPTLERQAKNIFIFHESTFNANDDQSLQWGTPDSQIIWQKSRGSGIMVSDFIMEGKEYLRLTDEEYESERQGSQYTKGCSRILGSTVNQETVFLTQTSS